MKRPTLALIAAAVLSASAPIDALAQRRPTPARRAPRRGRGNSAAPAAPAPTPPDEAAPELEPPDVATPDTDTLIQAIQAAALAGSADGARSIAVLALRGVPPRAAAAALDALGVLAMPEGAPAVQVFLNHRRPSLRRHAIAAAQAIHTPALVQSLAGKLRDSDQDVRLDAAAALAEVATPDIVPTLFAAIDRELTAATPSPAGMGVVHHAARAIARNGAPADVQHLVTYLRRIPFETMTDALRESLDRAALPADVKLRVVTAIGDLGTGQAREFLETFVNAARNPNTPLVQAARRYAERISQ